MKADEVYQCGKCGLCLMTCPVYKMAREETVGPRAKVHLIRNYAEQRLPATNRMQAKLQCCLMCGTCTAVCPGGVSHDTLFMRMRNEMSRICGRSPELKALGAILPREKRLRMATQVARLGTGSLVQSVIGKVRIGNIPMENFPVPNRKPFRDQVGSVIEPENDPVGTVTYFTGCATNHIYEKTGHAIVKVLRRMGYRVLLPHGQGCCALPLFFHGDTERARGSIMRNIEVLLTRDCDAVITDCATCGSALGRTYPKLAQELGLSDAHARQLADKVWDIGEFVLEQFPRLAPHLAPRKIPDSVTCHLPCHLKNHGRDKTSMEKLLQQMPHVQYRRTPDWDACCGGGGFFFNEFPKISKKMVDKKIAGALDTGSRFWATGCPGCRVQLSGNLPDKRCIQICHPMEIVARGLTPLYAKTER